MLEKTKGIKRVKKALERGLHYSVLFFKSGEVIADIKKITEKGEIFFKSSLESSQECNKCLLSETKGVKFIENLEDFFKIAIKLQRRIGWADVASQEIINVLDDMKKRVKNID